MGEHSSPCAIVCADIDKVIIGGNTSILPCDLDPGPGSAMTTGICAYFCTLDSTGIFQRADLINGRFKLKNMSAAGGLIFAGELYGEADFDPGPGLSALSNDTGYSDVVFGRVSFSGHLSWLKKISALDPLNSGVLVKPLDVDRYGNIYMFLDLFGSADFDPGPAQLHVQAGSKNHCFVLAAYDQQGDYLWHFARESFYTIHSVMINSKVTANGDVYIGAAFSDSLDADPGPGTHLLTPKNGYSLLMQKLSNCLPQLQPDVSITTSAKKICAGEEVYLMASGALMYKWLHGPEQAIISAEPLHESVFIVRGINSMGCMDSASVRVFVELCINLSEMKGNIEHLIYPNPAKDKIFHNCNNCKEILLTDMTGQVLRSTRHDDTIDISECKAGIYTLIFVNDRGERRGQKLMIK